LRWINGESVQLTGEEQAPVRVQRRGGDGQGLGQGHGGRPAWDGQVKMKMKDMRARGMSRLQIAQR
jgi:hypothetical protein